MELLLPLTLPKAIQHFTFNFHWTPQVYEKKVCTFTKQISYLDRFSQFNSSIFHLDRTRWYTFMFL